MKTLKALVRQLEGLFHEVSSITSLRSSSQPPEQESLTNGDERLSSRQGSQDLPAPESSRQGVQTSVNVRPQASHEPNHAKTSLPLSHHNPGGCIGEKRRHRAQSVALFVVTVVGLTGVTGQRFYDQPALDVGTLAPKTINAPQDATVINQIATEELRQQAINAKNPVLRVDKALNLSQYTELERTLSHGNELRQKLGPFPVVDTGKVSTDAQRYLRRISVSEWNRIRETAQSSEPLPEDIISNLNRKASLQLRAVGKNGGPSELLQLLGKIQTMRSQYEQANALLNDPDLAEFNAAYNLELFELSRLEWEQIKAATQLALSRILAQGIPTGLSSKSIDQAIALHLGIAMGDQPFNGVATNLLKEVLKPNLVQDSDETKRQAERAAQLIAPVIVSVRKDEAIVEANQEITADQLVLLDKFGLSERGPNWLEWFYFGGIIWLEVSAFRFIQQRIGPDFRRRDWLVVGMLAASTPILFALRIEAISLPAVGLLIGSFYGSPLGVAAVVLVATALPIGLTITTQVLLASAAGGLVGALIAGRLRSREELALLGMGVGFTQGLVHLIMSLIITGTSGTLWLLFLRSALFASLRGIAWSIVALGISPYLERLFDLITPIRMAELSNPNRPLLQRLAAETPGTFQHTLFVATLAEAAARTLGCNVELVRAGTLYHDIGKMHDPQGFIENQMGAANKHDLLNDPWKSAAIIKKHVTEGELMARRCRLPRALRSFIPEHQGTMRISYFYQQAQKMAAEDPGRYQVNEADFRYSGPIPQSRETGIVMLADSCEAALRSLKDATSEEALSMVKKIIRARWRDNQLCDSNLTKSDLETIADVFVQIWQQFHHKRIPYPSNPTAPGAFLGKPSHQG